MLRPAIAAALLALTTGAHADSPLPPKLTSCVGTHYLALSREQPRPNPAVDALCLNGDNLRVCRRPLNGSQPDNETTEVVVESNGQVIQKWNESSDPSYLPQVHVFRASQGTERLIVATQQSESQGMGVQEWAINVIDLGTLARRTYFSTEFGPKGSLVLGKGHSSTKSCQLLITRWETQLTRHGDRLFLVGQLIDLDKGTPLAPIFTKRFDTKLKLQREAEPADRPMRYFQP